MSEEDTATCKHPRTNLILEELQDGFEKTLTIRCTACNTAVYAHSRREVPGLKVDEDTYIGDKEWYESSRGFNHKKAKKMGLKVVKIKKKQESGDIDDEEIVVEDDDDE